MVAAIGAPVAAAEVASPPLRCPSSLTPPVDGAPAEGFDLPEGPYGPGSRGVTWSVDPGTPVRAPVTGTVTFSGRVVDTTWVTIRPTGDDSLLVTVGDVVAPRLGRGAAVAVGTVIGTSGTSVHLGLRRDGLHVDPAPLLAPRPAAVRLVADHHFGDGGGCRGRPSRPAVAVVSPAASTSG